MKVQLTLLLAYANVAFWMWMMLEVNIKVGFDAGIEHVPLIYFPFSIWLAIRVRRNELATLKAGTEQPSDGNAEKPPGVERES